MTRRRAVSWLVIGGTAALTTGLVGGYATPATASQPGSPAATVLAQVYAAARHLPGNAVGGVRAGTLHDASYHGISWATADFWPAASDSASVRTAFQDGAGGAVFSQRTPGVWQLVDTGPYGCGHGLPAALAQRWDITEPAGCDATPSAAQNTAPQAARLTGTSVRQKIVNIALSQVGVSDLPANTDFTLDCDPYTTVVGAQSPDADGCGYNTGFGVENENEQWCSDFAKWVWQQGGVTAGMDTIDAAADSFYDWGELQGQVMTTDSTSPAIGDAVVFFPAGQAEAGLYADHVGIITAVNAGGTVNLVNGDFAGADNTSVQYDARVNLPTWAAQIWGPGEQWIFVVPPAGPQQPAPSVTITGPAQVAAGTPVKFSALAAQQGASISQYLWTFGASRNDNVAGQQVSHKWTADGVYPVTVSATSSLGTVTTRVLNVDVSGASGTPAPTATPGSGA